MKNGVGRQHAGFTPWFWSYRLAAKFEAVVVVCVFAGVIAILALLFRMPGPLVVHVQDDKKEPIMGSRVSCTSPDGMTTHAGTTDVFGEAKWPGLAKGPWTCDVTPPDRFHAAVLTGHVNVVARKPAMWTTVVERPARIMVQVTRPQGQPRAKVAVRSRERDVDPVGACVGMRGSRVQSIMRELHGEKIDVILYSEDLITFAQNALAPAKITRVSPIHHEDGAMSLDCVVEDDQLSLAIGKKGQNVRLASALIGMKIEIKGESEVKGEVAEALSRMLKASRRRQTPLAQIPGIGEKTVGRLSEAGITTLSELLEKTAEELAEIPGLGQKSAEKVLEAARAFEAQPAAEEEEEAESGQENGNISATAEETTVGE